MQSFKLIFVFGLMFLSEIWACTSTIINISDQTQELNCEGLKCLKIDYFAPQTDGYIEVIINRIEINPVTNEETSKEIARYEKQLESTSSGEDLFRVPLTNAKYEFIMKSKCMLVHPQETKNYFTVQ